MKIVIINICAHDKACKERYSAITSHVDFFLFKSFMFSNRFIYVEGFIYKKKQSRKE